MEYFINKEHTVIFDIYITLNIMRVRTTICSDIMCRLIKSLPRHLVSTRFYYNHISVFSSINVAEMLSWGNS